MMIRALAKALANVSIFLEFSTEEAVDDDAAVQAMEQLGADLLELNEESRRELSDTFRSLSEEYSGEYKRFVANLPYDIGLEDDEDED